MKKELIAKFQELGLGEVMAAKAAELTIEANEKRNRELTEVCQKKTFELQGWQKQAEDMRRNKEAEIEENKRLNDRLEEVAKARQGAIDRQLQLASEVKSAEEKAGHWLSATEHANGELNQAQRTIEKQNRCIEELRASLEKKPTEAPKVNIDFGPNVSGLVSENVALVAHIEKLKAEMAVDAKVAAEDGESFIKLLKEKDAWRAEVGEHLDTIDKLKASIGNYQKELRDLELVIVVLSRRIAALSFIKT